MVSALNKVEQKENEASRHGMGDPLETCFPVKWAELAIKCVCFTYCCTTGRISCYSRFLSC